jgi:hypothetical protein
MKLLALAILLFLVPQDEKITLKFNPRKGDKLVKTQKLDLQLKFTIAMGDQEQEMEFEQRGNIKRTTEYAEVEDGKVTRLVIDCAEDYEEKKEPPTMEWRRTDKAMHGRKVTLFTKDGQLVREGADGLGEKDLKGLTLNNVEGRFFPDKPVAVGDTWEIKGDAVRDFLGSSEEIKDASLKSKLTSIKEIDKRRCAVINATLEMSGKAPNEIGFTGKMDVEIVVWIERGYLLSAKGKGKMTLKGENDQFSMSGEGPITIETTNKID